jgi:NhaP-type Na+/H+ or K+/H+ antiporter
VVKRLCLSVPLLALGAGVLLGPQVLGGEAGATDGLALVFVLVPALVLTLPGDDAGTIAGEAAGQVALALAGGLVIGYVAARLVDLAEDHQAASAGFFLVSALAMALLTLGAVHALGGTGVLTSFVAGVTFSLSLGERYAEELEEMQSALEQLLVVPVLVFFGAVLPWDGWATLGWSGLLFALWALVLRRPPAAALALAPTDTPTAGRGVPVLVRADRRGGDLLRALRRALPASRSSRRSSPPARWPSRSPWSASRSRRPPGCAGTRAEAR